MLKHLWVLFVGLAGALAATELRAQSQTPKPCSTEQHRAFDFWLGDWRVTANDKFAGSNSITLEQEGCVLRENWVSASPGYTGTSVNAYNSAKQQWQQLWVDNQGGMLELSGNLVEDQMVLSSLAVEDESGKSQVNRITWSKEADGLVRQKWDLLVDGKVEKVLFDGLYRPVEGQ